MSLSEKLASLADGYRKVFDTTDKFSIADMISGVAGLDPRDYIDTVDINSDLSWNNGVGSFNADSSRKYSDVDISRTTFKKLEMGHNYTLHFEMKGSGTFTVYAYPTNNSYGEEHVNVTLTDNWRSYSVTFSHVDDRQTGAFVRVNSDHQAMNFQIKDIELYQR